MFFEAFHFFRLWFDFLHLLFLIFSFSSFLLFIFPLFFYSLTFPDFSPSNFFKTKLVGRGNFLLAILSSESVGSDEVVETVVGLTVVGSGVVDTRCFGISVF